MTAYIGTSIPGQTSDGHSYLYSVQTGSGVPVGTPATLSAFTLTPATVVGGNASRGTVTLTAPHPVAARWFPDQRQFCGGSSSSVGHGQRGTTGRHSL